MLTLDKIYHASFVLKDVIRHTELVRADKITGALILTGGLLLLGAIITIKVFTEKKMSALIKSIESISIDNLPEINVDGSDEDVVEQEIEQADPQEEKAEE